VCPVSFCNTAGQRLGDTAVQPCAAGMPDDLPYISQAKCDPFEDGACDMPPAVFQSDPTQCGAYLSIPVRAAFASQVGEAHDTCRSRFDPGDLLKHRLEVVVWVELLLRPLRGESSIVDRTTGQPVRSILDIAPGTA
jgi:hypothetical protein